MAEQNVEFVEIKLNEVFVGQRTLRYIYFYHPDVVSTEWDASRECTPLFLGSDVLFECNINRNNLPRFHAKHAKRGLATKVNFPADCKVLGIHGTARGLWFYSIQGMFKIAFDYYSREDQDGCLSKLQKHWRRQILDPVLKKELRVDVKPGKTESWREDTNEVGSTNTIEVVDKIKKNIDCNLLETKSKSLRQELELLETYTTFMNSEIENRDCFVSRTVTLLKSCLALLPAVMTAESNELDFSQKEPILCEVAHWLGTEFASYHVHVDESVTAFKQEHIRNVENLPTAEVLVNEVFPNSMQILLRCWLRVGSPDNPENPTGSEDSVAQAPATLFPVVQLILELANQNLLSGVAHVLYSRLIRSESV